MAVIIVVVSGRCCDVARYGHGGDQPVLLYRRRFCPVRRRWSPNGRPCNNSVPFSVSTAQIRPVVRKRSPVAKRTRHVTVETLPLPVNNRTTCYHVGGRFRCERSVDESSWASGQRVLGWAMPSTMSVLLLTDVLHSRRPDRCIAPRAQTPLWYDESYRLFWYHQSHRALWTRRNISQGSHTAGHQTIQESYWEGKPFVVWPLRLLQ